MRITLRDIDNRDHAGAPFEFSGDVEEVVTYLDGPLRGDLDREVLTRLSRHTSTNVPGQHTDAGPGRYARRHALRDIHAFRCPDCGEVVVWDVDSDEWWTLDESDYGPDGSWPPGEWHVGLFDLLPP